LLNLGPHYGKFNCYLRISNISVVNVCRRRDQSADGSLPTPAFGRFGDIAVACANQWRVGAEISQQKLLGRLRTLGWMSESQLAKLSTATLTRRVRRNETIFFEGEDADHVFLLLSGVAKLTFLNASERILVSLVGPGEIFGVSSLLTVAKRPFRCDAFTDCVVGIISAQDFVDAALGVRLEALSRMLDVTVGRWWSMLLRYTNFLGLALRERLAGALLEVASKFGVEDARGRLLTLKLTHSDLAELVGASRQRITEQLSEFERTGVIIRDGRRLIIVTDQLLALVQGDKPAPDQEDNGASHRPAR
jgi:CRP-like cAMP-binding protein